MGVGSPHSAVRLVLVEWSGPPQSWNREPWLCATSAKDARRLALATSIHISGPETTLLEHDRL